MIDISFLNVGQGDSSLIKLPNGTNMLIDCKLNEGLLTWFENQLPIDDDENRILDYLVITHPHEDHIKGIGDLGNRIKINNIWESGHRLYIESKDKDKYPYYYEMLDLIPYSKSKEEWWRTSATQSV